MNFDYKKYEEWLIKQGRDPDPIFPVDEQDYSKLSLDLFKDINTVSEVDSDKLIDESSEGLEYQRKWFDARNRLYDLARIIGTLADIVDIELVEEGDVHTLRLIDPTGVAVFAELPITELQYIMLKGKEPSENV